MFSNVLTMGRVAPWFPSQWYMQMSTCAIWEYCARAHKAILYKIEDKLGKIKQAMYDVMRGLYFT